MTRSLRQTVLTSRCVVLALGGDGPLTSWGASCTAAAGRDGTLVVDPLIAPAHARLLRAAAGRAPVLAYLRRLRGTATSATKAADVVHPAFLAVVVTT